MMSHNKHHHKTGLLNGNPSKAGTADARPTHTYHLRSLAMSRWMLWIAAGIVVFFTAFGAISFMDRTTPRVSPYEDNIGPSKAEPGPPKQ